MNSKLWIAAGVCVAVVAAGGAVLLTRNRDDSLVPAAQAQAPLPAVAVQTTKPERRNVSRLIALPGDIHPMQEATLYAKVPGYLERIAVDKGDRIKAGELLAVIRA